MSNRQRLNQKIQEIREAGLLVHQELLEEIDFKIDSYCEDDADAFFEAWNQFEEWDEFKGRLRKQIMDIAIEVGFLIERGPNVEVFGDNSGYRYQKKDWDVTPVCLWLEG